jgi:hypothetical protein
MGQNMTYFGSFWVDFDPFWVIFGTPLFEVVPWVFRCFGLFWVIFGSKKGPKIGPNMAPGPDPGGVLFDNRPLGRI